MQDSGRNDNRELLSYFHKHGGYMETMVKIQAEPYRLAMEILKDKFFYDDGRTAAYTLRNWRGDFYQWFEGRYLPMSDSSLKNFVGSIIADLVCREAIPKFSSHLRNEIIEVICSQTGIPEQCELNTWLRRPYAEKAENCITLANTIVYVKPLAGGKWFEVVHNPEFFTLNILPYRYDEKADCPKWMEFLETITGGDKEIQTVLQQWAGYLLRNDLSEQKFLLCFGSGANGKGVFTHIMERMLGADNCSHVPLHQFANAFMLGSTLGKKLNSSSESSDEVCKFAESMLKSFVAGDRMDFARKFKEPIRAVPTAKVMISTNELPRFGDVSTGLWRRMILVPFKVTIPYEKQDRMLAAKLEAELSGIFNWALEGVRLLTQHNGFVTPNASIEALKHYRSSADPARMFLEENFVSAENCAGVPVQQVFGLYKKWCENNGYTAMNANQLGHRIQSLFPLVKKVRKANNNVRESYYEFLAIKNDSELNSYGTGQDLMFF